MMVLHTSIDPSDPSEVGTWGWFKKHEAEFPDWAFYHLSLDRTKDYDYADNIAPRWGRDDMLVWERDNVPFSTSQVNQLAACPEPVCAVDYEMVRCLMVEVKNVQTLRSVLPKAFVCVQHQRGVSMMRDFEGRTDPGDWTHAPNPPLGLTRFRWQAQERIGPFPRERWLILDVAVARSLQKAGLSAHIHRPRGHHAHRFPPTSCVHPAFAERQEPVLKLSAVEPRQRAKIAEAAGVVL